MTSFLKKIKLEHLREIFYFLSKALILSFIFEIILPGMILAYFNLNLLFFFWVLLFLIILGKGKIENK